MRALEAAVEAGFVYWGLFLAFGAILVGYLVWMWRSETPEPGPPGPAGADRDPAEGGAEGGGALEREQGEERAGGGAPT